MAPKKVRQAENNRRTVAATDGAGKTESAVVQSWFNAQW